MDRNGIKPNDDIKLERPHDFWLISEKVDLGVNSEDTNEMGSANQIIEYRISDFAKYLINPNPIEVMNTLVGCKVYYQEPTSSTLKNLTRKIFKRKFTIKADKSNVVEETFISDHMGLQDMEDSALQLHVNKIKGLLIPYDTLIQKMSDLNTENIIDVMAVVECPEGNRSQVVLKGTVTEKINSVLNKIHQKVGVVLERAYLNNGLFEMRGFDFESYDSKKYSRLQVVFNNDKPEASVLSPGGILEFNVNDIELVKYLFFLQTSLNANAKIKHLFQKCSKGEIEPLKLMFNKALEIDYSKTNLPNIYQEVFEANDISSNTKDIVVNALNQKQVGILISYLPRESHGKIRPVTNVYVMHDINALEPIKTILPQLYSEIDKKIGVLEGNKYYLMDSMKGYKDAE